MLRYLIIVLLVQCSFTVQAQKAVAQIQLQAADLQGHQLTVTHPVKQIVFWGASQQIDIPKNGLVNVPLQDGQTGFVHLRLGKYNIKLFVQKSDQIKITINEQDPEKQVRFSGSNAEGQDLFTTMDLPYPGSLLARYKGDSTAAMLEAHVEADKKVRIEAFRMLQSGGKINKAFWDFMQLNLDYYHASVISEVIASKYAALSLPAEHPYRQAELPADFAALWEKVYRQYSVNFADAMQTYGFNEGYNTYAGNYIAGYINWIKFKNKPVVSTSSNWLSSSKDYIQRIQTNLQPAVAENLEASFLFGELQTGKNYDGLLLLSNAFKSKYPNSSYWPYIQPFLKAAEEYTQKTNQPLTDAQRLVPGYESINYFRDIVKLYVGKTVFIEFWASWCITCKEEFLHQKELKSFLKNKEVVHLFISVDNDANEKDWIDMIKLYNVEGDHVRANPSLTKDLSRIFWGGKGYALPLYVIMNKAGNAVEMDAARPAEGKTLIRQIEKAL